MKSIDENFPRISIVTPSFNQAVYLEKCIKSVLTQNYPNLEYIVMDGGSTDGSVEIIKRYEPYITYWQSQPDGGQAAAIGEGFERSTGTLLSWINSDDFLCKGALFRVAEAYQENPSSGLFFGNSFWVDHVENFKYPLISSSMSYEDWIYQTYSVFQGSVFFSHDTYLKVGGINTNLVYAIEYDIFFKIAKIFPTTYIPHFLACFRDQPQSKSNNIRSIGKEEIRRLILELENIDVQKLPYKIVRLLLVNRRRVAKGFSGINLKMKINQKMFDELIRI
jgi:glycosyltransferase involved in cell wall biosynthesis